MKNLSAQCPKSAADLIKSLNENAQLSPGFSQALEEGERVLFIISKDVPYSIVSALETEAKDKPHKIIIENDSREEAGFDYFGVTKGRTPILMDKIFLEHDTVIAVSFVKYNGLFGFTGGKTLVFPGLAAEKSKLALLKHALDEKKHYKNAMCAPGNMKNNPLNAEALDALMIMRQNVRFFGINLIPGPGGKIRDVCCGDIFLSHISAAEKFSDMYPLRREKPLTGLTLRLGSGSLQDSAEIIEQASFSLEEGGRMFIDGGALASFGSEQFKNAFLLPKREDIFAVLSENFCSDIFQAMILKNLCGRYHIAVSSALEEQSLRQAGLNPLKAEEAEIFLKDCADTGEVWDAGGFAAGR